MYEFEWQNMKLKRNDWIQFTESHMNPRNLNLISKQDSLLEKKKKCKTEGERKGNGSRYLCIFLLN